MVFLVLCFILQLRKEYYKNLRVNFYIKKLLIETNAIDIFVFQNKAYCIEGNKIAYYFLYHFKNDEMMKNFFKDIKIKRKKFPSNRVIVKAVQKKYFEDNIRFDQLNDYFCNDFKIKRIIFYNENYEILEDKFYIGKRINKIPMNFGVNLLFSSYFISAIYVTFKHNGMVDKYSEFIRNLKIALLKKRNENNDLSNLPENNKNIEEVDKNNIIKKDIEDEVKNQEESENKSEEEVISICLFLDFEKYL